MTEHEHRTSLQELRASVSRGRGAGARLAERIQRTAEAYRGGDPLARFAADARGIQDEVLRRADRVLQDIEQGRARIMNGIERQTARLAEQAVKRLNLATEPGVAQLRLRVAECERRLAEREAEVSPAVGTVGGKPLAGERSA